MYWPPCWRTSLVLQHGGSILGSVILCGTFQRISQLWDNAQTLNLENCLLYLLSTISQFLDFVRCMVFDFIFYCVTPYTLYLNQHLMKMLAARNFFSTSHLHFFPADLTKSVYFHILSPHHSNYIAQTPFEIYEKTSSRIPLICASNQPVPGRGR